MSHAAARARPIAAPGALMAVLGVALVAAVAAASILSLTGGILLPPCPFKMLTGLACPGCGSLRAMDQLLHGHLVAALDLNPLAVLLFPLVTWQLVAMVLSGLWGVGFRGRGLWGPLETRGAAGIVLVAVVCFWILRNVNYFPFSLLAP